MFHILNGMWKALQPQSVIQFLHFEIIYNEPDWNMKVIYLKIFILQRLIDK